MNSWPSNALKEINRPTQIILKLLLVRANPSHSEGELFYKRGRILAFPACSSPRTVGEPFGEIMEHVKRLVLVPEHSKIKTIRKLSVPVQYLIRHDDEVCPNLSHALSSTLNGLLMNFYTSTYANITPTNS